MSTEPLIRASEARLPQTWIDSATLMGELQYERDMVAYLEGQASSKKPEDQTRENRTILAENVVSTVMVLHALKQNFTTPKASFCESIALRIALIGSIFGILSAVLCAAIGIIVLACSIKLIAALTIGLIVLGTIAGCGLIIGGLAYLAFKAMRNADLRSKVLEIKYEDELREIDTLGAKALELATNLSKK